MFPSTFKGVNRLLRKGTTDFVLIHPVPLINLHYENVLGIGTILTSRSPSAPDSDPISL